jgi:hypothetical protein
MFLSYQLYNALIRCCPTVSVTGGGAGMENAWEQRKLEARKMLETRENPRRPVHAVLGGTSCLFGRQILVFHFPSVIQGVKGGVPNQESQRPFRHLTSQLAL